MLRVKFELGVTVRLGLIFPRVTVCLGLNFTYG